MKPCDTTTPPAPLGLEALARQWLQAEAVLAHAVETERRATEAKWAAQQRLTEAVQALGKATFTGMPTQSGLTMERTIPLHRCAVLVEWRGRINNETFAARSIPYATPDAG